MVLFGRGVRRRRPISKDVRRRRSRRRRRRSRGIPPSVDRVGDEVALLEEVFSGTHELEDFAGGTRVLGFGRSVVGEVALLEVLEVLEVVEEESRVDDLGGGRVPTKRGEAASTPSEGGTRVRGFRRFARVVGFRRFCVGGEGGGFFVEGGCLEVGHLCWEGRKIGINEGMPHRLVVSMKVSLFIGTIEGLCLTN